jgi:ankyrin repeat protein
MLHKEWIEYLKRENKSENCDQIKNYYMPRKLRRFIQIDRKLLETKKGDNEKGKKEDDFTIVYTEEEFNEKCSQKPQLKNVHYLIQDENNQSQLKWQKSKGPISNLKKYLIMNKDSEESIDEEDIFHKTNNEKVLIISAEPGMGKSLILDHFTQNSSAENIFIKIILNTCIKTLSEMNFKERLQNREENLIEFVLKSFLNKTDKQEISLLKHLAKEEKLILMFDGLDEVNDYKEQVIQLIDALMRDRRLKKILITARNHLRQELEVHFNTFSFNLNNFDDEDQKNFLVKYWCTLNKLNQERPTSANKLMQSAEDLIERIKSISSDTINQLIGIPLQTKMLADIYFERVKNKENFSNLILNKIAQMYNEFIESKIKIHFIKSGIEIERNQDLFEEQKERFFKNHIKLSSSILFQLENDLTEKEEKSIIKYGVIVAFKNGIPTFLHQSFAEFFLAKSCLQKLKEQNKYDDSELKEILRDERHFLIRRFLNDLMENDENQGKHTEANEREDFNKEIENCCEENLLSLLKYFIQDKEANLETLDFIRIVLTSKQGHKQIVEMLLQAKNIQFNQQARNGYTALMWESQEGNKEIVQMLLQHENIEINEQEKITGHGKTALMFALERGHKEIAHMLLQNKNIDLNLQDEDHRTALVWASQYGHKDIVEIVLQNKNIQINLQDWHGNTALIWASLEGHKEIVQMLLKNKNIDLNLQDEYGWTALMKASEGGHREIVQMLLQHENIEINKRQDYFGGKTALMWASNRGHKEIAQILLQHKNIEINQQDKDGWTALSWAFIGNNKETAQMLLQDNRIEINHRDKHGWNALMWASGNGHKEIVQMLLQHENIEINQKDKNGNTELILASRYGHLEIVEMLLKYKRIEINLQDNSGYTALMWASGNGHKEIVQMLQDENIKKNRKNIYGDLALIQASENGHKEIVLKLLQDENIQINKQRGNGDTALMLASQEGHTEIVQILLQEKPIQVNLKNENGYTALIVATKKCQKQIVEMLLKDKYIEINLQDEYGYTALMWASGNGHKEIVQMLQEENIKKNQNNIHGKSALITASRYGHKEIVEMLLRDENIEINLQGEDGYTALMWASFEGYKEIVQMLLQDENIDLNLQNRFGELL